MAESGASGRFGAAAAAAESWLAAERHQLVLFVPVLLGAGIAAWFVLPAPPAWAAAMLLGVALACAGAAFDGLLRRCVVIAGLLFALGVGLAWWRAEAVAAPRLHHRSFRNVSGTVLAVDRLAARRTTRLLIDDEAGHRHMKIRIGVRGSAAASVVPGARISVRAMLAPPPGPSVPGGYHFARRAWFEGIGAVGYAVSDPQVTPPPAGDTGRFERFRERLTARLQDAVGDDEGGIAAALVTGDRGGIPEKTTQAMRDSGLAHLIAISGLHIAVVVGGVLFIVRRLLALSEWLTLRVNIKAAAAAAAASAGIAYTLVAGAGVPTIRACIAVLIVLIGLAAGREAISLRLVAVGAFGVLAVRPEYLLSPSFQLSFAAVTAIVALYQSPLGRRFAQRDVGGWPARYLKAAAALLATGVVAELALGPIALFHFNRMGLYGAAANLIAIPLTSFVILPLLILSLALDALGAGAPFYYLTGKAIAALVALAGWTAAMPGAVARLPTMPAAAFGVIVFGGLWLCIWQGRRRWLGAAPILFGTLAALAAPPPDLIVGSEGRHFAVVGGDTVRLLRPRTGDYVRAMWTGAAGVPGSGDLGDLPEARCNRDSCTARLARGGRVWTLLATRSATFINRRTLEPACRAADIVVSDRRLPFWCAPDWLKLDRSTLAATGAMAIWLDGPRVRTVAAEDGRHPWASAQ